MPTAVTTELGAPEERDGGCDEFVDVVDDDAAAAAAAAAADESAVMEFILVCTSEELSSGAVGERSDASEASVWREAGSGARGGEIYDAAVDCDGRTPGSRMGTNATRRSSA